MTTGSHRVDAYFSGSASPSCKRDHAEVFLGRTTIDVNAATGRGPFAVPILVPNQLADGVISLTTTDALDNTSEVGTGLLIDAVFVDGLD